MFCEILPYTLGKHTTWCTTEGAKKGVIHYTFKRMAMGMGR